MKLLFMPWNSKKNVKKAFFYLLIATWFLFVLISLWQKVFWLSIGMTGVLGLFFLFKKIRIKSKYLLGFLYLLFPVILAITLRVFIFEICVVPTGSMEDTLLVGDRVIINKLSLGPRMPRSIVEVPWLHGLFFYLYGNRIYIEKKKETMQKSYRRWKGFKKIKHQDIIIFNSPTEKEKLLIKRVVALPGDTFEIRDGQVIINGIKQESPANSKRNYFLWPKEKLNAKKWLDSLNIKFFEAHNEKQSSHLVVKLSPKDLAAISKKNYFDSITTAKERRLSRKSLWPQNTSWTYYNFGPVIIPQIGLKIDLSDDKMEKNYEHILDYELQKPLNNYSRRIEIKKNYYFVLGDNRDGSIDSRIFGLVPEDYIIGKGSLILFSSNKKTSLFSRSLKPIK